MRKSMREKQPGNGRPRRNSISKSFVNAKAKRRRYECTASEADEVHGSLGKGITGQPPGATAGPAPTARLKRQARQRGGAHHQTRRLGSCMVAKQERMRAAGQARGRPGTSD